MNKYTCNVFPNLEKKHISYNLFIATIIKLFTVDSIIYALIDH